MNTTILSNSIYGNLAGGIELDYGTNRAINSGQLLSSFPSGASTVVQGQFSAQPNSTYTLQFFTDTLPDPSGAGQGEVFLGSKTVTTDVNGLGRINTTFATSLPVGQVITATATDQNNATSAFFGNVRVAAAASADVSVSLGASASSVTAGDPVTFYVGVANGGPSVATGVVLTDMLPPGFTVKSVVAPHDTVTQANGVVRVAFPPMSSGFSQTIQIIGVSSTSGTVTNSASVTADQPDPSTDNNTATLDVVVNPNPYPLVVVGGRLITSLNSITGIVVQFNEPLDPAQAVNPLNYTLDSQGSNHKYTVAVPLRTPVYDPAALTVTLTPTRPLALGKLYQFQINGPGSAGLINPSGGLLFGNTSIAPAGPWVSVISRGLVATPPISTAPRTKGHPGSVRLVESVTTRRVLTGPATTSASGAVLNNLPPLVESSNGGTNTINTH